MTIIGNNWLNAQASRPYPLDDSASGVANDGTVLKDDILVDLHIRWPKLAGQYVFLGGITVTSRIITAVFLAADSPTTTSGFVPLASVTVQQPATRYRYYNLEPMYPGVGGFVAFGDTQEEFTARFSSPFQSLLSPKVGRPYDELPIPSIRKLGRADGLTGLVKLVAGSDLQIVKETINVEGEQRDAIVIRLVSPTATNSSILSKYIGPCGTRPESRNCARDGVETVNGVSPDCDGNLQIDFRGLLMSPFQSCGAGVTLDQNLGIADVCIAPVRTRFIGEDLCFGVSSISASTPDYSSESNTGSTPSDSDSGTSVTSSEILPCEELPFFDCFFPTIHHSWVNRGGAFQLVDVETVTGTCLQPATCVDFTSGSYSLSSSLSISASATQSSSSSISSFSSSSSLSSSVYIDPNGPRIDVSGPDGSLSESGFYDMGSFDACLLATFEIGNTGNEPLSIAQILFDGIVPTVFDGDPCSLPSYSSSEYVPCVEMEYNLSSIVDAFDRGEARIDNNYNLCSAMYGPNNCAIATLASNATTGNGTIMLTGFIPGFEYEVMVVLATSPYSTNDRLSQMTVRWGTRVLSLRQWEGNGEYRSAKAQLVANAQGELAVRVATFGSAVNTDPTQRVSLAAILVNCPGSSSSSLSLPHSSISSSDPPIVVLPYPSIKLTQDDQSIGQNTVYDFGSLSSSVCVEFVIQNTGGAPLSLDAGEIFE
jgi:hypothetical protein